MKSIGKKGLLQHGHSFVFTMVVTATGIGTRPSKISNRAPIKQDKVHSFENQALWEKCVLYEITAEAEEISEHLAPMTICFHRHNN